MLSATVYWRLFIRAVTQRKCLLRSLTIINKFWPLACHMQNINIFSIFHWYLNLLADLLMLESLMNDARMKLMHIKISKDFVFNE